MAHREFCALAWCHSPHRPTYPRSGTGLWAHGPPVAPALNKELPCALDRAELRREFGDSTLGGAQLGGFVGGEFTPSAPPDASPVIHKIWRLLVVTAGGLRLGRRCHEIEHRSRLE